MTAITHMGQPPANHVTLEAYGGVGGALLFVRTLPDGNVDGGSGTQGWRIPSNDMLVVTDVDWQYVHPEGPLAYGLRQTLRLFIENLAEPEYTRRVFESTITLSTQGQGGISEGMTSGFVISSAAKLTVDVYPGPTGGLQHLLVRGYLMQTGRAPINIPIGGSETSRE
jgi:hypothetical protein